MKGIVYCIECNDTGDKYIGSTYQTLKERMWSHKSHIRMFDTGKMTGKCTVYPIIKNGNYKYYPLEELDINDRKELQIRERHFIENTKCINKMTPSRPKKECDKAYREGPKREHILQQKKEWAAKNAERLKEHVGRVIECECGKSYTYGNKARHLKTLYHTKRVN